MVNHTGPQPENLGIEVECVPENGMTGGHSMLVCIQKDECNKQELISMDEYI